MQDKRPAKPRLIMRSILRAILGVAVDNVRLAGGNGRQYRPLKMPANDYIFSHAVDAGGILRVSYR
jgi:hypothetical protein